MIPAACSITTLPNQCLLVLRLKIFESVYDKEARNHRKPRRRQKNLKIHSYQKNFFEHKKLQVANFL